MTNLRQAAQQAIQAMKFAANPNEFAAVVADLEQALAEPEHYAAQNPLGGPAKVFDAMADAIRSGDDYHATLRRYGFAEVKALAEPEQEPVGTARELFTNSALERLDLRPSTKIYTAPTPRKPLTDEEISAILDDTLEGGSFFDVALAVARAIERAHGITGETNE